MRLFDEQGKVKEVNIEDMFCIRRDHVNRRSLYCNGSEWFYEANTLNELAQLYESYGFHKVDKNKMINLNKVDYFKEGSLWVNGSGYPVSRRNIPQIVRLMNQFDTD